MYIEGVQASNDEDAEREADRFAASMLIPAEDWASFVQQGNFTTAAITRFAQRINVAPGIVVGRLEHDRHIRQGQFHSLKVKLAWSASSAA